MELAALNEQFAIPGVLSLAENNGLTFARITTPSCIAEFYLHGAHLTQWQPTGRQPVLFLSERSHFAADKAIRGGVPLCFPWFGARTPTPASMRTDGPTHGFARTQPWKLSFAALSGDDLHLTLTLAPNDVSRSLGFDHFRAALELRLGRELRMRLTTVNDGAAPQQFGEALHTYFHVGDVTKISVSGLQGAEYLDKTEGFARKRQEQPEITFAAETDRLYFDTTSTVTIDDPVLHRRIRIAKENSNSTIVWNPWENSAAKLDDMAPGAWQGMVCVETANAGPNSFTLAPNEAHTMEAHITVEEHDA